MDNLILDQGNSSLKLALFQNGQLKRKQVLPDFDVEQLLKFQGDVRPDGVLISSVTHHSIYHQLKPVYGNKLFELSHHQPLPFKSLYTTPHTLGLDRIALTAAAVTQYPNKEVLIIDSGTCITYDFVDRLKQYHGGAISPGLHMRYAALPHFTARLPLVDHAVPTELIGDSTAESIRSGVVNGIITEVKGTIERYQERFPEVLVIITGGDLILFEPLLKNGIFAAPEFLLQGLNNILEYYAEVL